MNARPLRKTHRSTLIRVDVSLNDYIGKLTVALNKENNNKPLSRVDASRVLANALEANDLALKKGLKELDEIFR